MRATVSCIGVVLGLLVGLTGGCELATGSTDYVVEREKGDEGSSGQGAVGNASNSSSEASSGSTSTTTSTGSRAGCTDTFKEPNETWDQAQQLPGLGDCDSEQRLTGGVANHSSDRDFYWYQGSDTDCLDGVHPTASTPTAGVVLCLFSGCPYNYTCASGDSFTPEQGSGYEGCCVEGPGTVQVNTDCDGLDDSAPMGLLVYKSGADECLAYTVYYDF